MTYDWDVSKQVTERIIRLPKRSRDQLISFFDQIALNQASLAEGNFYDADGVMHHITTLDSWVVTYVIDDPVKLVHIIALE